ncbi:MAG: nuclear transport factor 2 family protein [Bacteroidales bacterium]|nr:nuclear transport factor 2 family protein [Bacteroidales bacterium]
MEHTTNWASANSDKDAATVSEFWLQSPDMCHVENGVYFKNFDSISFFLHNFYAHTDSMNVIWTERTILPLTNDIALMKGFFHFRAVFRSGDVFEGEPAFTGVFVRKEGKWALLQGHESFAMQ